MADLAQERRPARTAASTYLASTAPSPHRTALARALGRPLAPEPRGAAPALAGLAAPGFVAGRLAWARLPEPGLPLSRRQRLQRLRLDRMLGGSALLHVLLLALLGVLFARQAKLQPPHSDPAVQMVFGSSGMTGNTTSPEAGGGGKPSPASPKPPSPNPTPAPAAAAPPVPAPEAEPMVNPNLAPPPPPMPVPELVPLPPPSPPEHVTPQPPRPTRHAAQPSRIPMQAAPSTRQASRNPFANPMDLSFSQEAGPTRSRTGRPGGSHGPIDLSIGPLVRNGKLRTPYATVGIKGVSDDYGAEIDAWIHKHMFYPLDAAQKGEDGSPSVHVVIDRSGHVKSIRLTSSAGSYSLDDAIQSMFRNARLPPVPPDMEGDHFDIDLTINYILIR